MTQSAHSKSTAQPSTVYAHQLDPAVINPQLDSLVTEVTTSLSVAALSGALDAGLDAITAILRAIPIHEGRLLERGISLIAASNPDLVVLTDNLRLPVTPAAMQLVEKNAAHLCRALTLDADHGGRKSYTPDLLILNRRTRVAHVVDVKRSLSSYEVSRILELKNRMLAAALVVPDLLFREHRRLVADEVLIVIVNAEGQRSDIEGGVWPLAHLDHLLEVSGAGEAMGRLRTMFRERIAANWSGARRSLTDHSSQSGSIGSSPHVGPAAADNGGHGQSTDNDGTAESDVPVAMPRIGFARMPMLAKR